MSKKITPMQNESNQQNPNKGTAEQINSIHKIKATEGSSLTPIRAERKTSKLAGQFNPA